MTMMEIDPIMELNRLWEPVRPYLAQQVSELYGRHDGSVLEVGPFSGLALELARKGIGASFHRGAFFFPSFFRPDLSAIYRSLKPGGLAFVGGGFGSHTSEDVIRGIEMRSKGLNQALGRFRITERDLWSLLKAAELEKKTTMITEGGLWVVLRREFPT